MTTSARGKFDRAWAAVSLIGILSVAGLESFALRQGITGSALTAALVAIAALGGAGLGRFLT